MVCYNGQKAEYTGNEGVVSVCVVCYNGQKAEDTGNEGVVSVCGIKLWVVFV